MSDIIRFGVSIGERLLRRFDELSDEKGYTNRSEAIRDLIRDLIVEHEWEMENKETVGVVTTVHNHGTRELSTKLTDLQHKHHHEIISTMHIHLDEHNCLEVSVIKGKPSAIKDIANRLISTKGVIHGKLVIATSGKELS